MLSFIRLNVLSTAVLSTKDLALLLNELQDVTDPFKLISIWASTLLLLKKAGKDRYIQKSEVLD